MSSSVVFGFGVAYVIIATPDSADIADDDFAVVDIVVCVIFVVVAIVVDDDANAAVCVGVDYPPGIYFT